MLDALGRTIAAAIEKGGGSGGGNRGSRRGFEERHLRRVDKFGGRGSWSDWSFTLEVTTEVMDWVEATQDLKKEALDGHMIDSEADVAGSDLFDMLVGLTSGDALTIVRGTEGMNGFLAWKRLCERFNPNTPAKALALMMEVMNPKLQNDPNKIPQAIDE